MSLEEKVSDQIGIDAFARFASFPENRHLYPLIVLFDLLSAFPRVAHDWFFLTLEAAGAHVTFLNFIHAIYRNV